MTKAYDRLPIYYHGQVHTHALVDMEDYLRLSQYRWLFQAQEHYAFRLGIHAGRQFRFRLLREVLDAPKGTSIKPLNGDQLDCRRLNLVITGVGGVYFSRRHKNRPWYVLISIDGAQYFLGFWSRKSAAEEARQEAARVALSMRSRTYWLPRERVQRTLDVAVGRRAMLYSGEELLSIASNALPLNLPAEIKEEACQAIVLDLLTNKVTVERLGDSRLIRNYVCAAYGFQDAYRFTSIDAPVNDGESTLGELLVA